MEYNSELHRAIEDSLGSDSGVVKLVSKEGFEFFVKREHAVMSGTITSLLCGPGEFLERLTNTIHFKEITTSVLSKVCSFLEYKYRTIDESMPHPKFPIERDIAIELMAVADYLDL